MIRVLLWEICYNELLVLQKQFSNVSKDCGVGVGICLQHSLLYSNLELELKRGFGEGCWLYRASVVPLAACGLDAAGRLAAVEGGWTGAAQACSGRAWYVFGLQSRSSGAGIVAREAEAAAGHRAGNGVTCLTFPPMEVTLFCRCNVLCIWQTGLEILFFCHLASGTGGERLLGAEGKAFSFEHLEWLILSTNRGLYGCPETGNWPTPLTPLVYHP